MHSAHLKAYMTQIFHNHWLKVAALGIGSLIWLHVVTEKLYTFDLKLPLKQVTLRNNLVLATLPPDSILVAVSGTGKQLLRQKWRRDGARINASQFSPGRYRLDLTRANTSLTSPQSVVVEDILSPAQIQLVIDTIATKTVSVTPDVDAIAAEGFAIAPDIIVIPAEISLSGPRSKLSDISEIKTSFKQLKGLRNKVSLSLPLIRPGEHGFSISPDSVLITINVVPVRTRVFEDLPIVILNLPPTEKAVTEPATVRVELSGPPAAIGSLSRSALTVSVDYRTLDSARVGAIRVDRPAHFKIKRTSLDSVRVVTESDADPRD